MDSFSIFLPSQNLIECIFVVVRNVVDTAIWIGATEIAYIKLGGSYCVGTEWKRERVDSLNLPFKMWTFAVLCLWLNTREDSFRFNEKLINEIICMRKLQLEKNVWISSSNRSDIFLQKVCHSTNLLKKIGSNLAYSYIILFQTITFNCD